MKPRFRKGVKESQVPEDLNAHEARLCSKDSKYKSISSEAYPRLERLLKKDPALAWFLYRCTQCEWREGRWMFRWVEISYAELYPIDPNPWYTIDEWFMENPDVLLDKKPGDFRIVRNWQRYDTAYFRWSMWHDLNGVLNDERRGGDSIGRLTNPNEHVFDTFKCTNQRVKSASIVVARTNLKGIRQFVYDTEVPRHLRDKPAKKPPAKPSKSQQEEAEAKRKQEMLRKLW